MVTKSLIGLQLNYRFRRQAGFISWRHTRDPEARQVLVFSGNHVGNGLRGRWTTLKGLYRFSDDVLLRFQKFVQLGLFLCISQSINVALKINLI
jgi:hypothetical protein